jgi:hypothetical protein
MPKGNVKFKQSDVTRALKAVVQSGVNMGVEITPDGTIRIIPVSVANIPTPKPQNKPKTLF